MTGFSKLKEFISYFNTPFVRPKLKFYFGKVAVGTPYFFPRKWVPIKDRPGFQEPVAKKIGFDVVTLGWKTKWSKTDYRYEWSPVISFVFFKWQIAITILATEQHHYWESWLYYQYNTDKTKSKFDRAIQCQRGYSQVWETSKDGVRTKTNYYDIILKKKYRLKSVDEVREDKLKSILK